MALTGLAIAAGLALAKDQFVDKPKEARQRKLAGATQRLSPWTGMRANPVQESDTLGTMLQYGGAGAQMGAGYANNKSNLALKDQQLKNMQANPYSASKMNMNISDDPFWASNPYS